MSVSETLDMPHRHVPLSELRDDLGHVRVTLANVMPTTSEGELSNLNSLETHEIVE